MKIPTNTISQIPNPLQINSQYNFQKIQPTKSHKTTNTTTPLNTKQPKPPTTKRAGAARSVHPWGADRKNAQVGRVTQLVLAFSPCKTAKIPQKFSRASRAGFYYFYFFQSFPRVLLFLKNFPKFRLGVR